GGQGHRNGSKTAVAIVDLIVQSVVEVKNNGCYHNVLIVYFIGGNVDIKAGDNMKYISIMRPTHWSKNVFVFAALLFGRKLIGPAQEVRLAVESSIGAFFCFCLASSAMYILNDILDRHTDSAHPEKSRRPIASGQVRIGSALMLAVVCAAVSIVGSFMLIYEFGIIIVVYLVMTSLYSLILKRVMIVDVIIISLGFVLRAIAGAVVVGVFVSPWLINCTFTLCLFLGFGKRYSEIILLSESSVHFRKTLGGYTLELLAHMLNVSSGLAVVCFLLYTMDSRTERLFGTNNLVFTVPFVLYCIFRFSALIQKGRYSGPVQIILCDRAFELGFMLWVLACVVIIYANKLGLSLLDIVAY
ncbi:MAG: decaprenyl-phosphate phosphoribosyltransferase, partial [Sedimentisphaerales bacterium]|nr:decaprenyl-phosphate phosphoribosyltransferase [Sedimentisphaerales bacterium]